VIVMTTLNVVADADKAVETARLMARAYAPEAIEFLYRVMLDDDEEMTERVEAAKALINAGISHAP
jgi:hypothetical protein